MTAISSNVEAIRAGLLPSADAKLAKSVAQHHFSAGRAGAGGFCMICSQHATCAGRSQIFGKAAALPSALTM